MEILKFGFSFFGVNTYLVYDAATRECVVVDPGMVNRYEETAIKRAVEKYELKITKVINTHLHIDHVAGNRFIMKEYGVPVYAHPEDRFLGERIEMQAQMFGVVEKIANVDEFEPLSHGDKIAVGNEELEVIHTPGHSPGGISLYDRKGGNVLVGDTLFAGSIGRSDLPGGDYHQLIKSNIERLMMLPEETHVHPGHGPETTIGIERQSNPYLLG